MEATIHRDYYHNRSPHNRYHCCHGNYSPENDHSTRSSRKRHYHGTVDVCINDYNDDDDNNNDADDDDDNDDSQEHKHPGTSVIFFMFISSHDDDSLQATSAT